MPEPSHLVTDLKEQVVQTARQMHQAGLVVGSLGNVSSKAGGASAEVIAITPSGLPYARMGPQDIVLIDPAGKVLEGEREPSSEWRLHLAIYRARPEVGAVVHTHSPAAQAWSFLGEDLPARTEELRHLVGGPVRTAEYAPAGTQELADRAVEALKGGKAALLARHGVVGVGATLEEALIVCQIVERQAQVAWRLRAAEGPGI